ncbi:MAG: FimV/HubP family polar landmark protein [Pseudomonadota bacterium]
MTLNVHLRRLHGYVILSLCLLSEPSWSLGLGGIKVESLLNAPLEARIELLAVVPEDLNHLRAAVASPRDFDWVGINRAAILDRFTFSRPISDGDNTYIRVSTESPIQQSTLNFLVEVQWHKGRLLREYTIELDAPAIAIIPPEVVSEPSRTAQTPPDNDPSQVPQTQTAERKADTPELLEEGKKTPEIYQSVRGDTLTTIAKKFISQNNVTLVQMMIAIQQTNPQAFIKQNINGLKSDVNLRIPGQEALNQTSHKQAIAEVKLQNRQWRNRSRRVRPSPNATATAPKVGDPVAANQSPTPILQAEEQRQTSTKETKPKEGISETDERSVHTMPEFEEQSSAQTQDSGQLHIITQKDEANESGILTVAPQEYIDNLEKSARLAQELAESRRLETEEINHRIQRLETVISQQERLINLQNDQLVGLNQRLTTTTTPNDTPRPAAPQWLWFLGGMTLPLGMLLLFILYRQAQIKKERTQT